MLKLNLQMPKRPDRRHSPTPASSAAHELAAKLAMLHREHSGIGPLLFGIMYHREISDCPEKPETLAKLAQVGKYASDISKGMRLAAHVLVRGDRK